MISNFFRPRPDAPPSAPPKAVPVLRTNGGVQDLKVLRSLGEAPAYCAVLSATGGILELDRADQRRVAILDLGDSRCVLIWTNRASDEEAMRLATQRVRGQGMSIAQRFEASPDVIGVFYEHIHGSDKAGVHVEHAQWTAQLGVSEMEKRLEAIVAAAVAVNASDIHLRVREDQPTSIDFRVNGDLELYQQIPHGVGKDLTFASFNYADKGKTGIEFTPGEFQDARIRRTVEVNGTKTIINLRYASKPTYNGWDVVFRVLVEGTAGRHWPLTQLGYDAPQSASFERMLSRPSGLIAIVGTTGSGKSRTLQTLMGMLHQRYSGRKVLVTIEDPPEYVIPASQVPVRRSTTAESNDPKVDERAFAKALRACMRADPDVIMIGEVRDHASGRLCQEAVQTGHKVLTTLHAANPFEAMARFMDLGIERTILTGVDFLTGIIYQRLIPIVCPHCSASIDEMREAMTPDMIVRINKRAGDRLTSLRFRGVGCSHCRNSGIVGRTVAASILEPDMDILEFVRVGERNRASLYWRTAAMGAADPQITGRTALDHGIEKMLAGMVSPYDLETELGLMDGEMTVSQAKQRFQRAQLPSAARALGDAENG